MKGIEGESHVGGQVIFWRGQGVGYDLLNKMSGAFGYLGFEIH